VSGKQCGEGCGIREELLGIGVGCGGAGHMQRVAELDWARAQRTGHGRGATPEGVVVARGIHGQRWRSAATGGGARWPVEEPGGRHDEWQGEGRGGGRGEGWRWPVEEPDGRHDERQGGGHGGRRGEGWRWRVVEGSGDLRWRAAAAVVEGGGGSRRRRLLFK
jgi:hypothetical protein